MGLNSQHISHQNFKQFLMLTMHPHTMKSDFPLHHIITQNAQINLKLTTTIGQSTSQKMLHINDKRTMA